MDRIPTKALADVLAIADGLSIRVLLIGAFARDLCLPATARANPRQTRDADLALMLDDWTQMDAFFDACRDTFEVDRGELLMRHHAGIHPGLGAAAFGVRADPRVAGARRPWPDRRPRRAAARRRPPA